MEIFSNCLFKLIRFSAVAFCNYSILNTDVKWHSWVNSVEWRKLFKSGILNHLYCCVGLPLSEDYMVRLGMIFDHVIKKIKST